MSSQQTLFQDSEHGTAAPAALVTLSIEPEGRKLGPAQKQFNQLLKKIETGKAALLEMQSLEAQYLPERARRLQPLITRMRKLHEQMVIFLDQRLLNPKGLSKKVQADATTILLSLAETMVGDEGSNPAIEEIYQRRAPEVDFDTEDLDEDPEIMAEMQEMLSNVFGMEFDKSEGLDTPEALMEAALGKARAQQEAAQEARAARQAKRKKTARQQQQAEEALDSDKVIREIYRKLASALHPDREPDANERERKAALMAQVNTANDRRDLVALLELQLLIEQLNPRDVAAMADEKLRRFNRVLKEQEKSLGEQKLQLEHQIRENLNLAWNTPITARGIEAALRHEALCAQTSISDMQHDMKVIQQDTDLKRWIKQQISFMEAQFM